MSSFYDSIQNGIYNNRFVDVTPFSVQKNLTAPAGPFSNPYLNLVNPFLAPAVPPKNIAFTTPVQVVSFYPAPNGVHPTPVLYGYNHNKEFKPGLAARGTSGNGIVANGVKLSATGAGGIRAGFDPRIGQLALKLVF